MRPTIRLLLADDHPAMRSGLAALIQREPDLEVVGEAGDGKEAVEKTRDLKPEVILLDLAMPVKNGMEALREIHKQWPEIKVLIFSSFSDGEKIIAAMQAGAFGYLLKDSSPQEIFKAIRNASLGKPTLNTQVEISLLQQIQQEKDETPVSDKLTDREIEILRSMAEGLSNLEIAREMDISEGTVRSHVSHLINKLGMSNRAQAVIYAVKKGLIKLGND